MKFFETNIADAEIIPENIDILYDSNSKHCSNFLFKVIKMRDNFDNAIYLFDRAYKENPKLALKILMYIEDINQGLGKTEVFKIVFNSLCKTRPYIAKKMINYVSKREDFSNITYGSNNAYDFQKGKIFLKFKYENACNVINKFEDIEISLPNIVRDVYDYWSINELSQLEKNLLQQKWDSYIEKHMSISTLVVRDGSVSMGANNSIGMYIADSLTIYFSQLLEGNLKNKFINFSPDPTIEELKFANIYDNICQLREYRHVNGNNLTKIYELILDLLKSNKTEEIKRILIITDFDFNVCMDVVDSYRYYKKRFKELKLDIPEVVYWNINSDNNYFAKDNKQKNLTYIEGNSFKIIDLLINNYELDNCTFMNSLVSKYRFIDELKI